MALGCEGSAELGGELAVLLHYPLPDQGLALPPLAEPHVLPEGELDAVVGGEYLREVELP